MLRCAASIHAKLGLESRRAQAIALQFFGDRGVADLQDLSRDGLDDFMLFLGCNGIPEGSRSNGGASIL